MRLFELLLVLTTLASCASRTDVSANHDGRKPQSVEDYAFPGRSQ